MPAVRLRVTIVIDLDAQDYLEAAEHQKRLETYVSSVRETYPGAAISAKERRGPRPVSTAMPRALRVTSGKLHAYE